MIYIEYIERDRFIPLEIFRYMSRQGSDWADGADDRVVLQIGRTLRFGPEPSSLVFWEIPGIERLDSWEDYFASSASAKNQRSMAMHRAVHIKQAGLYDVLFSNNKKAHPLYYVEYYHEIDVDPQGGSATVVEQLLLPGRDKIIFVLQRVGWLGPDPAGIVVWGCDNYSEVELLSRNPGGVSRTPINAGVYKDLGTETL